MNNEQFDFAVMQPALERMADRYSCRSFSDSPIDPKAMEYIERAALRAASGGNLQPVSVIAVEDPVRKKELCALCEKQGFIEHAAVNFIFCMDWHKYDVYTRAKEAPFIANRCFTHFMIGMEDVMCMAQTVETAASLCGVGSCFVGSVCNFIKEIGEFLELPDKVFPVVMLSLGYPKHEMKNRLKKLPKEMVFCSETYTPYSEDEILAAYEEKYSGKELAFPKNEAAAADMLKTFEACLLTTYSREETAQIMEHVREKKAYNETQRRFGLHYAASETLELGQKMQDDLRNRSMNVIEQV